MLGGSVQNFCDMMNEKTKEIGLENTHFTTPHGLDAENHYSSAYDLTKLAEYLLNIEYLANIVKERSVNIKVNENTKILGTTNEMLSFYEGANGVKTGFTGNAGRCLVASATRNGRTLISVALGCGNKKQRTEDSVKLLNYGFENFEVVDICENMRKEFNISVEKGRFKNYKMVITGSEKAVVNKNETKNVTYKYNLEHKLVAPVKKGEMVGNIEIYVGDRRIRNFMICMPENIEKKGIADYLSDFIHINVKNYEIRL